MIKLSTAIREGAKIRPQCFSDYFLKDDVGVLCSCALGAAYETFHGGILDLHKMPDPFEIIAEFGIDHEQYIYLCPHNCDFGLEKSMQDLIAHLNDYHKWTREQIADHVESLGH